MIRKGTQEPSARELFHDSLIHFGMGLMAYLAMQLLMFMRRDLPASFAPDWMWGTMALGGLIVIVFSILVSGLEAYIGMKKYLSEDDRDE